MIEFFRRFLTSSKQRRFEEKALQDLNRSTCQLVVELQNCAHELSNIATHLQQMKDTPNSDLSQKDLLELRIQEYTALRSEQRTRLDSANKIIHYYAIVIAAIAASSLSIYRNVSEQAFSEIFSTILLLIPLVTLPFSFAQQNEEIIVRNIGSYFGQIKEQVSKDDDTRYWQWEHYHVPMITNSATLLITSVFRASLLIIFSFLSLMMFYFINLRKLVSPITWLNSVDIGSYAFTRGVLLTFDWVLIILAIGVAVRMAMIKLKIRSIS